MNPLSDLLVVPGIGSGIIARQSRRILGYTLGGGQPKIRIQRPTMKRP